MTQLDFGFSTVTADEVERGMDTALTEAQQILEDLVAPKEERTFENTMLPLDRIADVLSSANTRYAFMGYVHPEKEVRSAAKAAEEKMETFGVEMVFRDDLNAAVREYAATEEAGGLEGERARFVEFTLRDLRHAGHELTPEARARVKERTQRLVELGVRFQENIDEWEDHILVTPDDLEGLPPSFAESLDSDEETGKLKVTLAYPHVIPFVENARRRDLREELSFKFNTQAVEANRKILEEALSLRREIAAEFGMPSWAHHRLEERMAKDPERVSAFYRSLIPPLTKQGELDIDAMGKLLETDEGDSRIQTWDWRYYDTQQRRTDYGVDPFEVAQYFPLDSVLTGMFDLVQETFGLEFREVDHPDVWHPEVRLFAIHDSGSGEELSHFYLDLFPREGKYGHAAEFPLIMSRRLEDGSYQNPVCAMVANFTKPTASAPSLLQHGEVETLFHEFGHVLHQNLGRTELARFAGTNVERDFVEAPSQIMQHWVWRADVLRRFARHHETGEPIPDRLVEQLVAARQLNVAVQQLRQLQYGWWDQTMHGTEPEIDLDQILREGARLGLMPFHEGTFSLASFGHLMGGYDAAYYGYMWSEVFGDDMFSRFEEEGVTNPDVGMAYRREVLEKGGSVDADEMLTRFLGREPDNTAFLRKLGIE
ncbi:MAG TPA: M3 family metallopeptidase [Acidimicrobiia bacterium]|nr:M3 family metallopeptidase [Acidimicrobiia bacterium]